MGSFAYVVPPLPADETKYFCLYLVIPIDWVNPSPLLCAASDTAAHLGNLYILDPSLSFKKYGPTSSS